MATDQAEHQRKPGNHREHGDKSIDRKCGEPQRHLTIAHGPCLGPAKGGG